jgi:glycosyltransferase involved in cell wall biosynthesis
MRVAAFLGVMDEATLIAPCVAHLRRIGVTEFIVYDVGSTDGTRDWLRGQEGPDFRVLDMSNSEPAESWTRRMTAAVRSAAAEWVVMLDADEFPLPAGGDLRRLLAGVEADLLDVPRYNVVLAPQGPRMTLPPALDGYGAIELYVRPDPTLRARLEAETQAAAETGAETGAGAEGGDARWLRFVPLPKIVARRAAVGGLADGMHDIVAHPGATVRRIAAPGLVTAHLALSDYDRFARKVANAREMFRHHEGTLAPGFGWHWRRWIALDDRGKLREEFARSAATEPEIVALRRAGAIRSAAELLAGGAAA